MLKVTSSRLVPNSMLVPGCTAKSVMEIAVPPAVMLWASPTCAPPVGSMMTSVLVRPGGPVGGSEPLMVEP